MRVRWLARIKEFAWNSHFCDEQVGGPFASFRHCHRIQAETRESDDGAEVNGTQVTDEIEFTLPLGWLGRIGEPAVRRQLASSFAFRQRRLEELLRDGSGNRQ
jgi:ligand-binding SRPBCC domain-containing protein